GRGPAPGGAHAGAALPDVRRRARTLLGALLQLRAATRVAGHDEADGSRVLLLRLGGVGQLLVLPLVRARHHRPGLEPGAAQGTQGVQLPSTVPLGLRRRDEISWNMLTGLILHELGHSFLYHNWSFTRTGRFRRAFGEVRKVYRVADSKWVDFERRGVTTTLPDYVTAYAATHPQEDFA